MVRATFLVALFYFQKKHVVKQQNIFGRLIKINYIRIYDEGPAGLCSSDIYFYGITLFTYPNCLRNLAVSHTAKIR